MWRNRVRSHGRYERLEPCAAKVACTVLRGGNGGNAISLTRPFRRGRKFGTILVDLDVHQVIDVLAERSSQTSADWMRDHPEIDYISRDRGKDYAQGASEGAPQAIQISDRFHLMKNFVEAIEKEVARCYKHLRQTQVLPPPPDLPAPDEWRQAPEADAERKRLARQADKQERYAQIREVRLRGLSQKESAQRLAIGVRTVQRWQGLETSQALQPRGKRRSIFDPYAAYVLSRGPQGERSVSLLWQEIQQQGFAGSLQTMYRFVRVLRQEAMPLPAPAVADRVSVQKAIWLLARPYENLKADERRDLQEVCQANQELAALHPLAQSCGQIVRKREGHRLQGWMKQVEASSFREVKRFAAGLQRDKEEVLAGFTLVYSNGQVEGQINKLKLLKRTMYGRAGFPLLRQRVLHAL
jgi:transposase